MRYLRGYAELVMKYGTFSRHPLFSSVEPTLRLVSFRRVSMSREFGFCYFRVPKAANSTITHSLQLNMAQPGTDVPAEFPKYALHGVPHLHEMNELFVFTVVRSPVTRTLSAYLDKAQQAKLKRKYGLFHKDESRDFTFEDFLNRLKDGILHKDIHWAPQVDILPYDINKYDYIGKFEALENDLNFILESI
ncbi:MAG: sulfotransferase family 2 domain-containing protein, partial [Rhizobiaceae bacterium]